MVFSQIPSLDNDSKPQTLAPQYAVRSAVRPTQAFNSLAAIPDNGRSDVPAEGFHPIPSHGRKTLPRT
jgi:hypothetical protein